jgi:hypothetical protein
MVRLVGRFYGGLVAAVAAAVVLVLVVGGGSAFAASPAAAWSVDSLAYPSDFSQTDNAACIAASVAVENCDSYDVTVTDVGSRPSNENSVTIMDTLPVGVSVRSVSLFWSGLARAPKFGIGGAQDIGSFCTTSSPVKCVIPSKFFTSEAARAVEPDDTFKLLVSVTVDEPVSPGVLVNSASVSGGGVASPASGSAVNTVGLGAPGFGCGGFHATATGVDGAAYTQAGGHPYELSAKLDFNSVVREDPEGNIRATTVQDPRDIVVDLPVGVAGSAVSAPTCPLSVLSSKGEAGEQGVSGCPSDTIVGHIRSYPEGNASVNGPIYNIVPEHGVAAEFGFIDATGGSHVLYASLVPTAAGYVLRTTSREITEIRLTEITVNIYGDPAARDESGEPPVATFTAPTDCTGEALQTKMYMDSWQAPAPYNTDGTPDLSDPRWVSATAESPAVTGCEALAGLFVPSISAHLENPQQNSPTGLDVAVKVPQQEGVETLATPPLRDAVVTLPEGMTVNPSSANGLQACSLEQIGMSASGLADAAPPSCPEASKIGTVQLETPALPGVLEGSIYVAKQDENPFGSLLAMYIVVNDPKTGVIVKLPAEIKADASTGRLTTLVKNSPQFPFSELRTHFFGGTTAPLKTPAGCGTYTVNSELTPWSAPQSGPPATPSGTFEVNEGPGGGACSTPGFAPSFTAGTTNPQARGFSPFSVTFSRQDTDQNFASVNVKTPPGLLGLIKSVALCPEPGASQGECPPESLIGEATSSVGSGPDPYWIHGGQVFLTSPYSNGSFGLSIVVPTTAGPYTLTGNGGVGREIVRSSITVDPFTGQITVASDPLPTIIQGIPLQLRTVNVTVNRQGFLFNPSNCSQLNVTGTITSTSNTTANVSSPFHAAGCTSLPFKPSFTLSTAAKSSKANGASLHVKVTQKPGEADIQKVDLQLPLQLPSRLSTIQQACTETQFNTNPAGCPTGSNVGTATATTPILQVPLTGPGYFVSHGAAKFPDLEFVLQANERGGHLEIILDGSTDIKKGITYSRFETVPDAPITTFEANLPTGPHSILTSYLPNNAKLNFCGQTLTAPTTITSQNGAQTTQTTPITIEHCPTTLTITQHTTSKHTITLTLYIPTAGKLKATAKGLTTTTKTTTHPTLLTITLKQTHPGKLKTTIKLHYTPTHGKPQTKTLHTTLNK